MPPTDYTTFRVRGIPARTTRKGLQALISEAVSCQDASGVRVRSLAVDALRPREMVATITFADIPEELSDAGGNWTVEAPPDITLTIDTHFHGCTTLYCPPADEWKSDLIAISGLNGHAFGSFKKKHSSYMWLCDSLPRDVPSYRVIIYGYDTRLQGSRSFQNLLDIGKKFQTAIRQVRQDARRPLVLLGHSLGGIVAKEAINLMRVSSIDTDRLAFATIRGIIFFGVPNQGMNIRSLIPMVGDQANRGLLHTLDHNSPVLRVQAKAFFEAIVDLRCEILNFYETQESSTAYQNADGTWSMSGPPAVLVDTNSATHGRPNDSAGHRVYPIDCDHSSLVKFDNSYDEPYMTVSAFLEEIDKLGSPPNFAMTITQEKCFQSLGFREQYHRMDSLEPSPGTCDWLTTHELFTEWLQSSKGFLWIRGKPGTGKSMAMKHALRHVEDSSGGIVASFFIHGQGTELQKSILGIYRSLLHQIYPYFAEYFSSLTKRFQEYEDEAGAGKQDVKWSWMEGEIRQNFSEGLRKLCEKYRVIIVVDALDEAGEEQARVIFQDFDTLVGSFRDEPACHLSLCVSCRHYPDINFKNGKMIVMEDLNSSDIEYVVNSRLNSDDFFDGSEKQQLKKEILGKSEGIFQWTSLVTETVIRMRQKGDSFQAALRSVDRIPRGLDLLYKALLEPEYKQEHEHTQRRKLFQWVALAAKPLAPQELQHVLALHSEMTYRLVREYKMSDDFIAEDDFKTKIKNLSKGLIQINGSFQSGRIEFIHQSIPDFLLSYGGLNLLSGSTNFDSIGLGHFELSMTCLKYLFLEEIRNSFRQPSDLYDRLPRETWITRFPAISYAWDNWILHAVSGKEGKNDRDEEYFLANLMETFGWPDDERMVELWIPLEQTFGSPLHSWVSKFRPSLKARIPGWPCRNARLIHLLALTGLFRESTQKKMFSDIESPAAPASNYFLTPLAYALLGQQKQVVQNMIAAGVCVQYKTGSPWRSPLYLASLWGDRAVVSLLLKSGSEINYREAYTGRTALHAAASEENIEAMHILLDAGARINDQSISLHFRGFRPYFENGQSPLHDAVLKGKAEAVRLLVSRGADLNLKSLEGKVAPLSWAVSAKNVSMVRLLLELGADSSVQDSAGNSPLYYASYDAFGKYDSRSTPEKLSIVQLLTQFGCDVNVENDSETTLDSTTSPRISNRLPDRGADSNSRTRNGVKPTNVATFTGTYVASGSSTLSPSRWRQY